MLLLCSLDQLFISVDPETIDNTNVTHENSTGQSRWISG